MCLNTFTLGIARFCGDPFSRMGRKIRVEKFIVVMTTRNVLTNSYPRNKIMNIHQLLQETIKAQVVQEKQPFAVFDFDNTCIVNDVGEATLAYLCRNKLLKDFSLLDDESDDVDYHERIFHKYNELLDGGDIKNAYILNAKMFSGFTPKEADIVVRATIEHEGLELGKTELFGHIISHGLAPNISAIALLDFVRSLGVDVWIVSASTEVAVQEAMKYFGIEANLIGVRSVIDNGKYIKVLQIPIPIIEGKVECVHKYIKNDSTPVLAVDDSITGISILETAKIKVAINRENALTKEARNRGWFIL